MTWVFDSFCLSPLYLSSLFYVSNYSLFYLPIPSTSLQPILPLSNLYIINLLKPQEYLPSENLFTMNTPYVAVNTYTLFIYSTGQIFQNIGNEVWLMDEWISIILYLFIA